MVKLKNTYTNKMNNMLSFTWITVRTKHGEVKDGSKKFPHESRSTGRFSIWICSLTSRPFFNAWVQTHVATVILVWRKRCNDVNAICHSIFNSWLPPWDRIQSQWPLMILKFISNHVTLRTIKIIGCVFCAVLLKLLY